MRYKFYKSNEEAWVAMFDSIMKAEVSVYWESYILKNDTSPYLNFFDLLKSKARRGVKVRVVLDGFGSLWFENIDSKMLRELKDAGVDVLFFNSWFHRIHRKILIIDEKEAFLGGVNVANSYRKWLDLHLYIRDHKIIKTLTASFANSYFNSGGKNPYLLSIKKNSPVRRAQLWLLEHFPNTGKLLLKRYYLEKITMAEKTVTMVTPYFAPKPWLIKVLRQAVLRGVSVEIIIPETADMPLVDKSNYLFAKMLSEFGIKFYLIRKMNHAKALLVDNKEGLVGSNNLDSQSFDFNIEASFSFKRKDMVADLRTIIDEWKKEAFLFDSNKYISPWYLKPFEYILEKIAQKFF